MGSVLFFCFLILAFDFGWLVVLKPISEYCVKYKGKDNASFFIANRSTAFHCESGTVIILIIACLESSKTQI